MSSDNVFRLRKDIFNAIGNRKFRRLGRLLYRVLCISCELDKPALIAYSWMRDALLSLADGPTFDPLRDEGNVDNAIYLRLNPCSMPFADMVCNYVTTSMILLYANLESADESQFPILESAKKTMIRLFGQEPDWQTFHKRTFKGMFSEAQFSDKLNYTGEIFRVLANDCSFVADDLYAEDVATRRLCPAGFPERLASYQLYFARTFGPGDSVGFVQPANNAFAGLEKNTVPKEEKNKESESKDELKEEIRDELKKEMRKGFADLKDTFNEKAAILGDKIDSSFPSLQVNFVTRLWLDLLNDSDLKQFKDHAAIYHYLSGKEPPLPGKYYERIVKAREMANDHGNGPITYWKSKYSVIRKEFPLKKMKKCKESQNEIKRTIWSTEKSIYDTFELF